MIRKTTDWFPFYVKAFITDTMGLTCHDTGIYLMLLLAQWEMDVIPDNQQMLISLTRPDFSTADANALRTHCERIATVLQMYFTKTEKGWMNERLNEEKVKALEKSSKSSAAAKYRHLNNNEKGQIERRANALRTQSERTAIKSKNNNIKRDSINTISVDIPENGEEEKPRRKRKAPEHPLCPQKEIIALYHELLPDNPPVVESLWKGSQAEKRLRDRWQQAPEHQSMGYWQWFFSGVAAMPFYAGQNSSGWKADLGWLLRPEKFREMVARLVGGSNVAN